VSRRHVRTTVGTAVAVAVMAVLAAGCGSSSSSSSSTSSGGAPSSGTSASDAAATTTQPAATSTKKFTIGIVSFASSEPTSTLALQGLMAVAKQNGWSASEIDPNGSESAAIAGMQDFVQKKVDVIITAVFPSKGLLAGALAAKDAGIPVVSLSGGTGVGVQTQWDAGTLSGKLIVAKMLHDTGAKGALLAFEYNDGLPCVERQAQLNTALKAAHFSSVTPEQVPIPGQVTAGTSFASAWLAKHPGNGQPRTIWGCFDDPVVGAISAIKSAGQTGINTYGIDASVPALEDVLHGTMTATVFLNAYLGGEELARELPTAIANGVNAAPKEFSLPAQVVDQQNIKAFLKDNPDVLKQTA
jgi:ribose transport system substrate-binding protein